MGAGIAQVAAAAGHVVKLLDNRPGAAAKAIEGIRAQFGKLAEQGQAERRSRAGCGRAPGRRRAARRAGRRRAGGRGHRREPRGQAEAVPRPRGHRRRRLHLRHQHLVDLGDLDRRRPAAPRAPGRPALLQPGAADEAGRDRLRPRHRDRPWPTPCSPPPRPGARRRCMRARRRASSSTAWPAPTTPRRCASLNEGGSDCATLDAILRDAGGFRMGPFELMDMIGHDVNFAVTRSVLERLLQRLRASRPR